MVSAQVIPNAQQAFAAHTRALAAFEMARSPANVAASLEELATLQREATGLAREIEALIVEYGRPAPFVDVLDAMQGHADQIARGFVLVATGLEQARRHVLAGTLPIGDAVGLVRAQAQIGALYFEQLGTLIDRLRGLAVQAHDYFDLAFARVEADPAWNEKLREAFGTEREPLGVRIDEIPDDDG